MKVLIACEFSGVVRETFAALGHDAWSCDLLPTEQPGQHYQGDVLDILSDGWDMMIAHPPCTYLTTTRNRWWQPEYRRLYPNQEYQRREAIEFFMALAKAPIDRIAIENPIGIMSSNYKPPTQIIQPYEYGHPERKSTCLWLKNLPRLSPTNIVEPQYALNDDGTEFRDSRGYRSSPTHHLAWKAKAEDRALLRSRTYKGVAEAMASQWGTDAGLISDLPLFYQEQTR